MPSVACHTTVDIEALGFDTDSPPEAEIIISTTGEHTLIEVAHTDDVWSLTFDEHGALTDGPAHATPAWLGPAIKTVVPQLQGV